VLLLLVSETEEDESVTRTALAVQQVSRSGLTPVMSDASDGGHSIPNDGAMWIEIVTTTDAVVLTVDTPGTVDGNDIDDRRYVIGAPARRKIGPWPPNIYNQPDGSVHVDLDVVTGVTIGAFRA
jgi:hypothetical protein